MIELQSMDHNDMPQILVIGIGGGGNNAIDRMLQANTTSNVI